MTPPNVAPTAAPTAVPTPGSTIVPIPAPASPPAVDPVKADPTIMAFEMYFTLTLISSVSLM